MWGVEWWAWLLAGGVILAAVLQSLLRHRQTYQSHLEPDLARRRFTLISVRVPGLLKRGPFPWLQFVPERRSINILGVSGQYEAYQAVTFRDSDGHTHEAWAMLVFQAFSLAWITWKPSLEEFTGPLGGTRDQDRAAT